MNGSASQPALASLLMIGLMLCLFPACEEDVVDAPQNTTEEDDHKGERKPSATASVDEGHQEASPEQKTVDIVRPIYKPWVQKDTHGQALPAGAEARFGSLNLRHPEPIVTIAYGSEGNMLVSGSADGLIRFWDATSGDPRHQELQAGGELITFDVAADGSRMLVATAQTALRLYIPGSNTLLRSFESAVEIHSAALSPDLKTVVAGVSDGSIKRWNAETGEPIPDLSGHQGEVVALAFSPDGERLASLARDGSLRVWTWDGSPPLVVERLVTGGQQTVSWSPDGSRLAVSGRTVTLLNADEGEILFDFETGNTGENSAVAFSRDGKTLFGADLHSVRFWNTKSGALDGVVELGAGPIGALAQSSRTSELAVAVDRTLVVIDTTADRKRLTPPGHASDVTAVDISWDGTTVATAGADGSARLWSSPSSQQLRNVEHRYAVSDVAIGADARTLLTASPFDGAFIAPPDEEARRIWDEGVHRARWVRGGRQIVLADAKDILRTVDPATGEQLEVLAENVASATMTAVPFGNLVAVARKPAGVLVFDLSIPAPQPDPEEKAGKTRKSGDSAPEANVSDTSTSEANAKTRMTVLGDENLVSPTSLALSPDGSWLAMVTSVDVTGNGELQLWSLKRKALVNTMPTRARSIAFSVDGRLLLLGRRDGAVEVVERDPFRHRFTLTGHVADVVDIAFGPDGQHAITASKDTTALKWSLGPLRTYVAPVSRVEDGPAPAPPGQMPQMEPDDADSDDGAAATGDADETGPPEDSESGTGEDGDASPKPRENDQEPQNNSAPDQQDPAFDGTHDEPSEKKTGKPTSDESQEDKPRNNKGKSAGSKGKDSEAPKRPDKDGDGERPEESP